MDRKRFVSSLISLGLVLVACDRDSASNHQEGSETSEASSGGTLGAGTDTGPGGDASEDTVSPEDTTSGPAEDTTGTGDETGGGAASFECDPMAQDCPEGHKCMPYEKEEGSSWDATKCVPLDPAPDQLGDACTAVEAAKSGFDSCDKGLMCWGVDPETLEGECIGFCQGSSDAPTCEDPTGSCVVANDGALPICLPGCDPLLQDCGEGAGCYPVGEDGFVCGPDSSDETGVYGDPCEFINACDPGFYCSGAAGVPNCAGAIGCCTPFCDISEDPSTQCTDGAAGGQQCVAWFDDGQAPPSYGDVGGCVIPE